MCDDILSSSHDDVMNDTVIFALSDLNDENAISYNVSSTSTDMKGYCIEQTILFYNL